MIRSPNAERVEACRQRALNALNDLKDGSYSTRTTAIIACQVETAIMELAALCASEYDASWQENYDPASYVLRFFRF